MNLLVFELLCAVASFVKKSMFSTSMLLCCSLVNTSSRNRSSSKFSCVVPSHFVGSPNVPRMCRGSELVNPARLFYQQVVARQFNASSIVLYSCMRLLSFAHTLRPFSTFCST